MKKFVIALLLVAFVGAAPAFAQGDGTGRFEERKDDIKEKMDDRREDRREDRKDDMSKQAPVALTATQIACIKTAVLKREDALIAGHDAYALAVKNAYTARKAALSLAWDKATSAERKEAVRAADRAFDQAVKAARKTWNEARRSAWKAFENDRKACVPQGGVSSSETGSSKSDASL